MARQSTDTLNGFLDPGCTMRGELEFASAFRLDGRLEGTVTSKAELVVGDQGKVEGTITVARCLVGGTVRGTISAVLHSGAKVWADIVAPTIVMEDGAFFEGKITMSGSTKQGDPQQSSSARRPGAKS